MLVKKEKFSIKFDGPAIENGEIDVHDFAPAVLSFADLVKIANKHLNNDQAEASIKLKATNKGSFEAVLMLDVSFMAAIADFFTDTDKLAHANQIVQLLIGGGTVTGGLIWLIKKMAGEKPTNIQDTQEGVELTMPDGNTYTVTKPVAKLYELPEIRQQIEKATQVLEKPGIQTLSFNNDNCSDNGLKIDRSERSYFLMPQVHDGDDKINEFEEEKYLEAVSIHFKEGHKWRFRDGEDEFSASIVDADFINMVQAGEVRFLKGDAFFCLVHTRQVLSAKGLKKECKILRVIEHRSGSEQMKLF